MERDQFDRFTRGVAATMHRRGLGRLLAGGALGGLLARIDADGAAGKKRKAKGKNKKPNKKKGDCPRGQKKDPHGICGFPPTDCLTVGGLCGLGERCCSDFCLLVGEGDEAHYRCMPGKARCLTDFGCVPGYVCRGYRCQPA